MPTSTALVAKSISKSNSKSNSKAMAIAMHAETTTNKQILDARLRAEQTSHVREVFVARQELQLFFQKVSDAMDAEHKPMVFRLLTEARMEAMQLGMGLQLHTLSTPEPAAPIIGDYEDDLASSDGEAPPPPSTSKPAKGKGSGKPRPGMKGKRTGWNLFRSEIVTHTAQHGPPPALVERDRDLTDEQKVEMETVPNKKGQPGETKQQSKYPMYTKDNFTKLTGPGIYFAYTSLTEDQRKAFDERAADEWATLCAAREAAAASAPSGSGDSMVIEDVDEDELPTAVSRPKGGKAAAKSAKSGVVLQSGEHTLPELQHESESDDNDAPPSPKPKSKRPVEETTPPPKPPAEEPPTAPRKPKRSTGRKSARLATPEVASVQEPSEQAGAPATTTNEEEPSAEELFGEDD